MEIAKSSSQEDWGVTHYPDALLRQKEIVQAVLDKQVGNTLILTEHWPIYTLGSRKGAEKNLVLSPGSTSQIPLIKTNRGGDITYHGPGQVVAYPIIDLNREKDLHQYLRQLEDILIHTLGCFGLAGHRRPGKTGIWLEDRKIAAIGVAVRSWVSYHGLALNVNLELSPFGDIIPCGIQASEGSVTSMQHELGYALDMDEVKNTLAIEFWKIFPKVNPLCR